MVEKQKIMEIASLVYDITEESENQKGVPYVDFNFSSIVPVVWTDKRGFEPDGPFEYHSYVNEETADDIINHLKDLLEYAKERRKQCTSDLARNQEKE